MPIFVLPFPQIDPVLIEFGPFVVRWYALAYIAGLILGWRLAFAIAARPSLWGIRTPPSLQAVDDLLVYMALGIVIGGRLGHIVFYEPSYYLANPTEIFAVWHGGMAFHGGLIGACVAMVLLARIHRLSILSLTDIAAIVSPIGLFFGRIANFINGELWGRPSDVPWAMVFPRADEQPRHPSQLYEAGMEGLAIRQAMRGGMVHRRQVAAAAKPGAGGDDEAGVHMHRRHPRAAHMRHQRNTGGEEAWVLLGA